MMRPLALSLVCLLSFVCLARAEAPLPTGTVLHLGAAQENKVSDVPLTDLWIARMAETRARRQRIDGWASPVLLGGAALLGAAGAALPDVSDGTRYTFAASAVLAAGAFVPSLMAAPDNKARWLAAGGSAFAMAFGAAGIVEAQSLDSCRGWCGNERAVGWLGGALLTQGALLLPLAFIERGPSLAELEAYASLPVAERAVLGKKLLARVDRAERKAAAISIALGLISTAVFAAGAAVVRDRDERIPLLALGGATLAIATTSTLAALLRPTRLERLAAGARPGNVERIVW